jgi:retron-type reverse transcriptase
MHDYHHIISIENLLLVWQEFIAGKRSRRDVQEFGLRLMGNIIALHRDLAEKIYVHQPYLAFKIADPKPRDIHKASVRDRLLHRALYRKLYPFFERRFIADSYSCQKRKGTHKALNRFRAFSRIVGRNGTRTCWVLKCDIRKFFANIDHAILMDILAKHIADSDILVLLRSIIGSFNTAGKVGVGLPLGNLTSQLLVNIYMNEFDTFVKHALKEKYYIRYADDFVFLSESRVHLEMLIPKISTFLKERLKLELHPNKLFLKTLASGMDFLGWVHFSDHRVLRTATKNRMVRRLEVEASDAMVASYRGLLSHGNGQKLSARYLP